MEKEIRIVIEKVANGYVVYPGPSPDGVGQYYAESRTYVFEYMGNLIEFIKEHFDPRPCIEKPPIPPQDDNCRIID